MPSIGERLARIEAPQEPAGSLWEGPSSSGANGGVTFSMLSGFLQCRERFRIKNCLGWKPAHTFNHRIEYGNMWHACEEQWQGEGTPEERIERAEMALVSYTDQLHHLYPFSMEQIAHWSSVCGTQFPIYASYWEENAPGPDDVSQPLYQEKVFDSWLSVPDGYGGFRPVRLRGKIDSIDAVGTDWPGVYIQENKTKGDIDILRMQRQLTFDLQSMMYAVALLNDPDIHEQHRDAFEGIRYNVVRRPLSGGKGSIVRKKGSKNVAAETHEQFYARVAEYIRAEPATYFMRWKIPLTRTDIAAFQRQTLMPLLGEMCRWWDAMEECGFDPWEPGREVSMSAPHWRHPFGVYNALDEGGASDLDSFLESGNTAGLARANRLFTELG